ncbi:histidine phosphatase family protein [Aestuariivirga sp.]|uniref:histidine phosphatase family protein n=1 Tax=Aestuariivirga sp. TaxID=2650926 RepID=UPI0039190F33
MTRSTTFHLVRHAAHDRVGSVLVGRLAGVHLSSQGRAQARSLAGMFARSRIGAVISSPRERAIETAEPIAGRLGLAMLTSSALDEADFGFWQGKSFSELSGDAGWKTWNATRGAARPPGGESMAELAMRFLGEMLALHAAMRGAEIVLVSHAEPIRATLLTLRGLSADDWSRIDIEPASISTVALDAAGAHVLRVNAGAVAGLAA